MAEQGRVTALALDPSTALAATCGAADFSIELWAVPL